MGTPLGLYTIRIKGRLGATAFSAFPSMVSQLNANETVLTGWLEDRSALFGVLAQIEAPTSNCSSSDGSERNPNRLNQTMTTHQTACEATTVDAIVPAIPAGRPTSRWPASTLAILPTAAIFAVELNVRAVAAVPFAGETAGERRERPRDDNRQSAPCVEAYDGE